MTFPETTKKKDMKCIYEDQIIFPKRKKNTHSYAPGRLTNGVSSDGPMDLQVDHTLNMLLQTLKAKRVLRLAEPLQNSA